MDEHTSEDNLMSRTQRTAQRRMAEAELAAQDSARTRAADIAQLAQRHGMADKTSEWLSGNLTIEQVREKILTAKETDPATLTRASGNTGLDSPSGSYIVPSAGDPIPAQELRRYSLIRAIRSQVMSDSRQATREAGFELEVSRTLADHSGRSPKGIMVPESLFLPNSRSMRASAIRAMNTGTGSQGGNLVATDLLGSELIETLNNEPQVFALGARRLDGLQGNAAIPRITTGSAVAWLAAEGNTYNNTQPVFDQPTMTPHDLAAYTTITRRLLLQSSLAADQLVRSDLALRIGIGIDAAAIIGSGASGQPTGLLNTSGVPVVSLGTNGAAPTWAAVTALIEDVAAANGLRGNLGFLTSGSVMGTLWRTAKQSGYPSYIWEAGAAGSRPGEGTIAGFKAVISNSVPDTLTKGTTSGTLSALIFGNWSDLLIGFWSGVDILIDPYSLSTSGSVQITAISTCDVLVRHPLSFSAILDAITT